MNDSTGYPQGFILSQNDACEFVESPWEKIRELEVTLDFNGYYIAYLLGMHTDKKFEKIAVAFAKKT